MEKANNQNVKTETSPKMEYEYVDVEADAASMCCIEAAAVSSLGCQKMVFQSFVRK
jgi:hypothetical protein